MIYLASPYSHDDPNVRLERYDAVCSATAWFIQQGYVVFSPIAYSHQLLNYGLHDWIKFDQWRTFDEHYLRLAESMWVLCLDGWEESVGVVSELQIAGNIGLPILFLNSAPPYRSNAPWIR